MSTETPSRLPAANYLQQAGGFALRSLRTLGRNTAVLFWAIAFPAMFYLLSVYLFIDTSTIPADVIGTVKATTAISYGTFGALIVFLNTFSQSLVEDIERERYAQFRALPIAPAADFLGRFAAAYLFAIVAVVGVLALGVATGAEFSVRAASSIPIALLGLLALGLFAASIAVALVAVIPESRYVGIIAISAVTLSYFLTGYNGVQPGMVASDPGFLNAIPNALATRLAVHHLVPIADWTQAGLAPPGPPTEPLHAALLAGYAVLGFVLSITVTRRVLYRGEI